EYSRSLIKLADCGRVVMNGELQPKTQQPAVEQGGDIMVATPGRFLDLYLAGHIVTRSLNVLVIDEADKMMDMGFIGKLHRILEVVPRKRQNLLFSATMGDQVHRIAGDFLEFPTVVEVTAQATPAQTVTQTLYPVPNFKTKINLLQHLLQHDEHMQRLIIFCKTKASADNIFKFLERKYGTDQVRVIHANKGQNSRI